MAELNIKKEIGKRILAARKAKDLTLKELGKLAGGLKQTRLTNWEQGTRAPGPEEIKLLAAALDVSPAFLMCLSDEMPMKKEKNSSHLIPLLNAQHSGDIRLYVNAKKDYSLPDDATFISASMTLLPKLSDTTFALKMIDESMTPDIRVNDVLVIDPTVLPNPGDYVAVELEGRKEVIICQYKKLSYASPEFELRTLNDNWPNIKVADGLEINIIGKVIQKISSY